MNERREKSTKGFLSFLRAGESQLAKNLTSTVILSTPFSIVALAYWAVERSYNKWLLLVFLAIMVPIGTFGFRVSLLEKMDEIDNLSREEAKGMGLSLDEAKDYEKKKVRAKVFKQWVGVMSLTFILGVIFVLGWPV